jgi:hypothetical protein
LVGGPLAEYAYHHIASGITDLIAKCAQRLKVISPRTKEPLLLTTRRLRYTFASKMVRQGTTARDLAELLDHTDTQHVQAYTEYKGPRTAAERVLDMQKTIEELRAIMRSYDERWALYEYNLHRLGHDPEELRRPLDPLARSQVRARHQGSSMIRRRLTMLCEHSTFFGFASAFGSRDCRRQCIPLVSFLDGRDCYCGHLLFPRCFYGFKEARALRDADFELGLGKSVSWYVEPPPNQLKAKVHAEMRREEAGLGADL